MIHDDNDDEDDDLLLFLVRPFHTAPTPLIWRLFKESSYALLRDASQILTIVPGTKQKLSKYLLNEFWFICYY